MKAKDLRIGNWIKNEVNVFEFDVDTFNQIDELSGIPLSEEWLEMFGFKQNENSDNWWNKEADCSIDVEPTIQPNAIELLFYYHLCKDRRKNLLYVHQLQNLYFALTGEELTLKP